MFHRILTHNCFSCNKGPAGDRAAPNWVTRGDLVSDWWIKLFYCKTARQLTYRRWNVERLVSVDSNSFCTCLCVYVLAIEEIWVVCCISVGCRWIKAKTQEKRQATERLGSREEKGCQPKAECLCVCQHVMYTVTQILSFFTLFNLTKPQLD